MVDTPTTTSASADPYAEFGGATIPQPTASAATTPAAAGQTVPVDPYAEFGGATIPPAKETTQPTGGNVLGNAVGGPVGSAINKTAQFSQDIGEAANKTVNDLYGHLAEIPPQLYHVAVDPPKNPQEHYISVRGGPVALASYRAASGLTDAVKNMWESTTANYEQSKQKLDEALAYFHAGDYRNAASSAGTATGANLSMIPGGGMIGEPVKGISEGARPGANLSKPTAQAAVDAATALIMGKAPEIMEGISIVPKAVGKVAGKTVAAVSEAPGKAVSAVGEAAGKIKEAAVGKPATAPELVGKVTQATGEDVATAAKALKSIDTSKVETYQDLSKVLDAKVKENTAAVDEALSKNTQTFKPAELEKRTPVEGGTDVVSSPVMDALNQLRDYYEKTNDTEGIAKVQGLQNKVENGLTVKEVNDIARLHGKDLNAYNAAGELASGLQRKAAENTRTDVKDIVRKLTPDEQTKALDKNTSDLITTREMADRMAEKVQKLQNKFEKAGLLQKTGAAVGKVVDIATGGIAKGLLKSLTGIGDTEGTTLNAIKVQENLAKNLKLLDKLNEMDPAAALKEVQKIAAPKSNATTPPAANIPTERETFVRTPTTSRATPPVDYPEETQPLTPEIKTYLERQAGRKLSDDEARALDRANLERGMATGEKPGNPIKATGESVPGSSLETRQAEEGKTGVLSEPSYREYKNQIIPNAEYKLPTEPAMHIPLDRRPAGTFSLDIHHHEHGHAIVAAAEGFTPFDMKSHLHPESGKGTVANTGIYFDGMKEGENSLFTPDSLRDNLHRILSTYMGGAAANELFDNIPMQQNRGLGGDLRTLRGMLKDLRYSPEEAEEKIQAGLDRAKQHLTEPGIEDILKANAQVREPGLPETHHMSPERMAGYLKELKRIRDENADNRASERLNQGTASSSSQISQSAEPGRQGENTEEPRQQAASTTEVAEPEPQIVKEPLLKTPITDALRKNNGLTENPLNTAFITSNGDRIRVSDHDNALDHADVEKHYPGIRRGDSKREAVKQEGLIRAGTRITNSWEGSEAYFSVPESGVTPEQIEQMKQTVVKMGRNGRISMERSDVSADTSSKLALVKEFARPSDIEPMLREIQVHPEQKIENQQLIKMGEIKQQIETAKKQGSGFVVDMRTGKPEDTGFLVEIMPEKRIKLDHDATPKDLQKFYNDNRQLFREHPELRIGGYKNELNISAHTNNAETAKSLAGKLDQHSIWDVKAGQEIKTGGKGQQTKFQGYPFEKRIEELRSNQ